MLASPWQYWQTVDAFKSGDFDEYDIGIHAQPKQRVGQSGHTKLKTRDWESNVFQAAGEQAPETPPLGRIGLEVLFFINSKSPPRHDLSNAIKTLEDALNRRGYHDDRQIDYLKALRVYGPEHKDRIIARIYERAL